MISSSEEFVLLRRSLDYQEYRRATHDSAPENVWNDVITSYPEMKEWVAHNKTVPLSVLRVLAGDSDPRVRFAVATKRKCDRDLLSLLSHDPDPSVRLGVAYNPKTPHDVLLNMLNDEWSRVVEVVSERLEGHGQKGEKKGDIAL